MPQTDASPSPLVVYEGIQKKNRTLCRIYQFDPLLQSSPVYTSISSTHSQNLSVKSLKFIRNCSRSTFDAHLRGLQRHKRASIRRSRHCPDGMPPEPGISNETMLAERLLPSLHSACESVEANGGWLKDGTENWVTWYTFDTEVAVDLVGSFRWSLGVQRNDDRDSDWC